MVNRIINNRAKSPFIINIELTEYCPLHCKQCYKKMEYKNLDWDIFRNIVEEAKKIGVKKILLSGGEPLCYPFLFEAIDLIKKSDMYVCMSTSGCGVNKDIVQKLRKSGIDMIYISLNGSSKEINELSRDGYDEALYTMGVFHKAGILYRVNWVARKDNIDDFEDLITLSQANGANGIDILFNKPNVQGIIEAPLNLEDMNKLDMICKKNPEYVQYQSCFYQFNKTVSEQKRGFFSGCLAGKAVMAVFADGTFSICPHIYAKEKRKSIMGFWESCKELENNYKCKLINSMKA